jgi:hypothetical protein
VSESRGQVAGWNRAARAWCRGPWCRSRGVGAVVSEPAFGHARRRAVALARVAPSVEPRHVHPGLGVIGVLGLVIWAWFPATLTKRPVGCARRCRRRHCQAQTMLKFAGECVVCGGLLKVTAT